MSPALLPLLLACALTPVEKCEHLLDEVCDNAHKACDMGADECLDSLEEDWACDAVTRVGEDYDACLDAVKAAGNCLYDEQLPVVCAGVLWY